MILLSVCFYFFVVIFNLVVYMEFRLGGLDNIRVRGVRFIIFSGMGFIILLVMMILLVFLGWILVVLVLDLL